MSRFEELEAKPNLMEIQDDILEYWKSNDIFQKSVDEKEGGEIVFYDGPPFPTGKPHHGTVLVSFIKDMLARYRTMRGYKVPRVWGWDCHGLPIENQAETALGITDKNEIEKKYGIDKFNEKCFEIVSQNNDSWKEYVEQMARWVDYEGAYKTMNTDYMESVMWAFKQCYEKGLIYRDHRVTPYCMHCETSLSISDTRESDSTRMRQDRWIIVKFKTELQTADKPTYLLAWTTTPWTLPSNMCLAVGKELLYSFVDMGEEVFIICSSCLDQNKKIFGTSPDIIKTCSGQELLGITYTPLFPYFEEYRKKGAFRVVSADYVGSDEGVGIVHTAPAFGEDDYWTCRNNGVPLVNPVDSKGFFTEEISDFYSSAHEKNVIEMNPDIIRFLYQKGSAVADGTIEHNYPHCWRCRSPLIYKAMDAWYFDIGKIKDRLIELNEEINWVPETVKKGRFGNWLLNARDWNISRNRYWSTPIPIWECEECGNRVVLGSIEEIHKASSIKMTNLHRQYMDKVTFQCDCCGKTMRRVPEVLDCWFESGAVPFAQKHYPFENKEWFESHFPSDFIVEYTGQIRCWFYYLHVLAVALFDRPAYKNCIVHGTVLAKDGKKLSKSSKNYTDPMKLLRTYGTDSFRLYLYQTNAMLIGDLLFDEKGLKDAYQQIILPYWNACNFFISYANIDDYETSENCVPQSDNILDQWILAKLFETERLIQSNMDSYQVNRYVNYLITLLDGLTNWYIRRSRRRFWESGMSEDKKQAYQTLYYVLICITKLFAPVAPIISEKVYRTLTGGLSVHLSDWPQIPEQYENAKLLQEIELVREIIYLARNIRNKNNVKNRQPLNLLRIALPRKADLKIVQNFQNMILEELNVKNLDVLEDANSIAEIKYLPDFEKIRNGYPGQIREIAAAIKKGSFEMHEDEVLLPINGKPESFSPEIILTTYLAKDNMPVASGHGIVVSLDLTLTDELKAEGVARDIVRNIQDARKKIGCDIQDTITISIEGSYPDAFRDYICEETLASIGKVENPEIILKVMDDREQEIGISISRA